MRKIVVIVVAAAAVLATAAPCAAAQSAKVAALQVALRSHGLYTGAVDGVSGPMTRHALIRFQRRNGIRATGKVGMATRCKLGKLGTPLLGQRQLSRGRVGWDVASLEFKLRRVRAARAARRRALRRGNGGGTAAVPARTRPHARRDRGCKDFRALVRGGRRAG